MDFHRIKKFLKHEHTLPDHEWKGAVLFLCNDTHVFFIKRSEFMPTHGGQVAFMGGHKKSGESFPWEVACREFVEESGLSVSDIEFIGHLPAIITANLQPIIPIVTRFKGTTDDFINNAKSNGEWDSVFAYSWEFLSLEQDWNFAWRHRLSTSPVLFHTIKAQTFASPHGNTHSHLLWGATAQMVWDFLRLYFKG